MSGNDPRPKNTCSAKDFTPGSRINAQASSSADPKRIAARMRRIHSRDTNRARNDSPEYAARMRDWGCRFFVLAADIHMVHAGIRLAKERYAAFFPSA